jgi:hypothetical protein
MQGGARAPLTERRQAQILKGIFKALTIIGVLREHEAGAKTADLASEHGGPEATL